MAFSSDESGLFSLQNTVLSQFKDSSKEELCRLLQELFSEYIKQQREGVQTNEYKSNN